MAIFKKEQNNPQGVSEERVAVGLTRRAPNGTLNVMDPVISESFEYDGPQISARLDAIIQSGSVDPANKACEDAIIQIDTNKELLKQSTSEINKQDTLIGLNSEREASLFELKRIVSRIDDIEAREKKNVEDLEEMVGKPDKYANPIKAKLSLSGTQYTIDKKSGHLVFSFIASMLQNKRVYYSFFAIPLVAMILTLIPASGDVSLFYIALRSFLYDSSALILLSVIGLAFAQDVIPSILAVEEKKQDQGFNVSTKVLWILRAVTLAGLLAGAVLTISTKDMVLPDFAGTLGHLPLAYALVRVILSCTNTLGCYGINYVSANPLQKTIAAKNLFIEQLYHFKTFVLAIIKEMETDSNFYDRNKEAISKKIGIAQEIIKLAGERKKAVVRHKIAEFCADPISTNMLTEDDSIRVDIAA